MGITIILIIILPVNQYHSLFKKGLWLTYSVIVHYGEIKNDDKEKLYHKYIYKLSM